jgi:hypothetical protein
MAHVQYQPSREMMVYLRWRSDSKEKNTSDLMDGIQIEQRATMKPMTVDS